MKTLNAALLVATLSVTVPAMADVSLMGMNHGAAMTSNSAISMAKMSQGTIRKIDKGAGKITITHGPLENLGMPGMTMAFFANDKTMLNQVAVGDKVHFVADNVNGNLTLIRLERAN